MIGLNCPACGYWETQVQNVRNMGDQVKRYRICMNCGYKFTTIEDLTKPKKPHNCKRKGKPK